MIVGVSGGFALIGFGLHQIFHAVHRSKSTGRPRESWFLSNSIFLGVILSALNPFFIIWWFTVGSKLILEALIIASLSGVFIMYLAHVWMDYAWLTLVAALGKRSMGLLVTKTYHGVLAIFGLILVYFGVGFLSGSIFGVSIIP